MTNANRRQLTITLPDELRAEALHTVLAYEGAVRGLKYSQTLVALLLEAADVGSYPEELRRELEAHRAALSARASEEALCRSGLGRSA